MLLLLKKFYNFILLKTVPKRTKKNFIKLSEQYEKDIRKFLLNSYFTKNQKIESNDLEDHINRRIIVSRSKIIPWIMKTLELKNKKVLEVGSGTGSSSITLAEQGAVVTGIDLDNNSIKVARHRAQMLDLDIEFLELSGIEINKLNQSFDVVIYYAALEHMTIEERIESLQQAFYPGDQLHLGKRLEDVIRGTQVIPANNVIFTSHGSHHDNRDFQFQLPAHTLENLKTIHDRHFDIEYQQGEFLHS